MLGRPARILGLVCVLGLAVLAVELIAYLPYMPNAWWLPQQSSEMDFRNGMVTHFTSEGMLGAWAYLVSLVWLPWAWLAAFRSWRRGAPIDSFSRVITATVTLEFVLLQVVVRMTPLKYSGHGLPLLCSAESRRPQFGRKVDGYECAGRQITTG
jgi:hypothetical protein